MAVSYLCDIGYMWFYLIICRGFKIGFRLSFGAIKSFKISSGNGWGLGCFYLTLQAENGNDRKYNFD